MTASLWVPGPLPGLNEMIDAAKGAGGVGKHYAHMKRDMTAMVKGLAVRERLPTFPGRVSIRFTWVEKNQRRDPDNVAAARKFVLDGLVSAGVLRGDGWKHVLSWTDHFYTVDSLPGSRGPGVGIMIEDFAGAVPMTADHSRKMGVE